MARYSEQFAAARQTNLAVRALEASFRAKIVELFAQWESGTLNANEIRWALEAVVRDSYRSSAAMALVHISVQAGVPRWLPRRLRTESLRTRYLDELIADVRRNLREYKASDRTGEDRRRAISRISHSAGVSTARGYTDGLIRSARELAEDHGFLVKKYWKANFVNHIPCPLCSVLDGSSVGLEEEFPTENGLKVYGDLKGPPRHPRCMCWLVMLIEGLDNHDDVEDEQEAPSPSPDTMTSEDVRKLPAGFFVRILRWLRTYLRSLRSPQK